MNDINIPDSLSEAVQREVLKYEPKKQRNKRGNSNNSMSNNPKKNVNMRNKSNNNSSHIPAPSTRIKNKIMKPPLPKQPARRRRRKTKKQVPKFVFKEPENL